MNENQINELSDEKFVATRGVILDLLKKQQDSKYRANLNKTAPSEELWKIIIDQACEAIGVIWTKETAPKSN